ncbi:MAG: hypothetical protein R3251_04625 [Candidatus Spechtbacterales bacterium]|nr:hypothetical protein [Candidatus Spechtbacterales bacterium]
MAVSLMPVSRMAYIRFEQMMRNTKNFKRLKDKCRCIYLTKEERSRAEDIASSLRRRFSINYGIRVDSVEKIGVAKFMSSKGGEKLRPTFWDKLKRKTYPVAGIWYPALGRIEITEDYFDSLPIVVHEIAHALDSIELNAVRTDAEQELLASVATYMFMCEYTGHICERYSTYIGYALKHGANANDLILLKSDIGFIFNKMHSLMQAR